MPQQYWDGLESVQGLVSIQAAFRCTDWTLLFVDHNVMITFHVMALKKPCMPEDLTPGSTVSDHEFRLPCSSNHYLFTLAMEPHMERHSWAQFNDGTSSSFQNFGYLATNLHLEEGRHTHFLRRQTRSDCIQRLWCSRDLRHAC